MPRPTSVPKCCLHKASGKAVVRLNGRDHYLGMHGTPEAKHEYDRLIAEWLAAGRCDPVETAMVASSKPAPISVNEVLLAFWRHAGRYYRNVDGTPTTEIGELRHSLRPLRDLYGRTPAEFGPKRLEAVRRGMIEKKLCRTLINRRMDRVKRVFKWAASQELIPGSVYEALRTLDGLRRGRTEARERDPVAPVPVEVIAATRPFLDDHLRPGEVCGLTFAEVERTGDVWLYRPADHKTAHDGRQRVVPPGPEAQAAIIDFRRRDGVPPTGSPTSA